MASATPATNVMRRYVPKPVEFQKSDSSLEMLLSSTPNPLREPGHRDLQIYDGDPSRSRLGDCIPSITNSTSCVIAGDLSPWASRLHRLRIAFYFIIVPTMLGVYVFN